MGLCSEPAHFQTSREPHQELNKFNSLQMKARPRRKHSFWCERGKDKRRETPAGVWDLLTALGSAIQKYLLKMPHNQILVLWLIFFWELIVNATVNWSCFDQKCALPSIFLFSDSSGASFPASGFRYCKYVNLKLVFQVYFLLLAQASLFLQALLILASVSYYLCKK